MKKIIKLTESDLTRIIKRIVEETEMSMGVSKKGSLTDIAKKRFSGKDDYMDIYKMTQNPNSEWTIVSADGAKIAGSSKNLDGKIIKSSDFIDLTDGGDVSLKPRRKEINSILWVNLDRNGSIGAGMVWD
jgi:hypothetical protein